MEREWGESLKKQLIKKMGDKKGISLYDLYAPSFPTSYHENNDPEIALQDITQIEALSEDNPIMVDLYPLKDDNETFHLKLYQLHHPIALSDILPMLENMDIRTLSEQPYSLPIQNKKIWISDFKVMYAKPTPLDLETIKPLFQDAFIHIQQELSENDGFNKLVLGALLSWRDIVIARAYSKYLHQTGFRFSQAYIEHTFSNHPHIIKSIIELFKRLHDPKTHSKKEADALEATILNDFDAVTSLDEDRILRRMLCLVKATLRTNYFQKTSQGISKPYLSIKLKSADVPELPLPLPLYEIFIYSPRFEGIHLRSAKVARGGIRWSDRKEDFRTEILGLMKAQKVKNAVIVPSGAKGGFVLKKLSPHATRDIIQAEVVECYQSFIKGLLDITDNLKNEKVIRPNEVVCLDDEDPYLVVAADKGTATFSDIANRISREYNFWLDDAFASGGSTGYDHKKMGITARGAWESIKRHFQELNIDVLTTSFTMVGIGDMSGDVFGNGLLYTNQCKLLAAFDHRHIFLDPTPDPQQSYDERQRLFNLPTSSWNDYNANLISKGGGVFPRTSKSISLSPEIKKALSIEENQMAPNDLIRAILKAPVDLLFNGGIGTYVKASTEAQAEVGDKTNEFCRINGNELRAKIVGEGGNLGFTQLGRIEYALTGGLINTDFIDNSAGVDCSDHEVNIKILLNKIVQEKKLTMEDRNQLLVKMTDNVASLVLKDNYDQALAMSFSALRASHYTGLYQNYIKELVSLGLVDRVVEFLPDDKKLLERKAAGIGLTRPEMAVLLAYTKIIIKNELLKSDLPEDPYFNERVTLSFPSLLCEKYHKAMEQHPLRRELIATEVSNQIVNEMGITFAYRIQIETGATVSEIARAHTVSMQIFKTPSLEKDIHSLSFKIPISTQYELLHHVRHLLNLSTRWFLKSNRLKGDLNKIIEHYRSRITQLQESIPTLMSGATKTYLDTLINQFMGAGIAEDMAKRFAASRALYTSLNIIEVETTHSFDLMLTTQVYFLIGEQFNLVWFRDHIAQDAREGHWNNMARLALRDELDILQRKLTMLILKTSKKQPAETLIEAWLTEHARILTRWNNVLSVFHESTNIDYAMFFIALKELDTLLDSA